MQSGSFPTRGFLLGSLAMLVLFAGAGCPLLPEVIGFIELQIDTAGASKGVTGGDFQVTCLAILVRTFEDEILRTIEWEAEDGARSYLIPAKEPGEHKIEVTHFGQRDGVAAEAVDTAFFDVREREVTVIEVVPGCIGVIRIEE